MYSCKITVNFFRPIRILETQQDNEDWINKKGRDKKMRNVVSEGSQGHNDITPHEMLLNCHQIIIAIYEQVNFNLYSQTETTINVASCESI